MASVSFRKLGKSYGDYEAVKGIDLEIADCEFVVLVGPSGCGKSTTLRMVAGLEKITSGEILIGDTVVNARPPRERDIAMVFQDYALYPHKTARENMAFSLKVRGLDRAEIDERVAEAAAMLGIGHLLDRKPAALSGGQRQRVAMGRAIVRRPKVFLFDEPLSNLDAQLRGQVRAEINRLHHTIGTTVIYVTHDQVEAMTLADRIVVMRGGVIEQVGAPDEVYGHPESVFVAGFIGAPAMNFLPARIEHSALHIEQWGSLPLGPGFAAGGRDGEEVIVGLRPEHLVATEGGDGITGEVQVVEPLGSDTLVHLGMGGKTVTARLPPEIRPVPGSTFSVGIDPAQIRLFDRTTERAIA